MIIQLSLQTETMSAARHPLMLSHTPNPAAHTPPFPTPFVSTTHVQYICLPSVPHLIYLSMNLPEPETMQSKTQKLYWQAFVVNKKINFIQSEA